MRRSGGGIEECDLDLTAEQVQHNRTGALVVDRLKTGVRLFTHQLIEEVGRTVSALPEEALSGLA
jgi:hypothetical protein